MTQDCINLCVQHLLENLKKYPHDKKSIWKCLEGVGRNHPWTVLPLVPQLLSQHPYLDVPEPDPEDPAYVSVLILVFNAAKGCLTMKSLFDERIAKHYHYLRDTLPHLVPDLSDVFTETVNGASVSSISVDPSELKDTIAENGRSFLKKLIHKLKNSSTLPTDMQYNLGKLILNDLKVRKRFIHLFLGSLKPSFTKFNFYSSDLPKWTKTFLPSQNLQHFTFVQNSFIQIV